MDRGGRMDTVKIFYKDDCPLCPMAKRLKDLLIGQNIGVEDYNVDTAYGLAEATFYHVLAVPTVLIEDEGETIKGEWRGKVPEVEEVLDAINNP
jgi:glutaredoxin